MELVYESIWLVIQQPDPDSWPKNLVAIFFAYLTAGLVGLVGYLVRVLSSSGAIAACVVGGTIFAFGGARMAALLVLFFVTSSALSLYGRSVPRKRNAEAMFEKGGRRDAWQVLANGGVAAIAAFIPYLSDSVTLNQFMVGVFCGSLATATADTWATEIGVLSPWRPRLITGLRAVEPGTSGGVTLLGLSASVAGAAFIGLGAMILGLKAVLPGLPLNTAAIIILSTSALFYSALIGGVAGSLVDSLLGATVQGSYHCPRCDKPTERRVHGCGTPTNLVQGVAWVNNDVVNALATLAGGLVGGAVWLLLYN